MSRRRAIAIIALLGALDSTYLLLEKLGYIGALACGITHGCERVNTSTYATFLGVPVSAIGLAGYVVILTVALIGAGPRWAGDPAPDKLLAGLAGLGLVFSLYLTYAELFVIRAVCQWCVFSQLAILTIFVLASWGLMVRRTAARRG